MCFGSISCFFFLFFALGGALRRSRTDETRMMRFDMIFYRNVVLKLRKNSLTLLKVELKSKKVGQNQLIIRVCFLGVKVAPGRLRDFMLKVLEHLRPTMNRFVES